MNYPTHHQNHLFQRTSRTIGSVGKSTSLLICECLPPDTDQDKGLLFKHFHEYEDVVCLPFREDCEYHSTALAIK